jgi:glutaredoxin
MAWRDWLRLGRKKPCLADWRIVMYTRQGCHLCETAWGLLADEQRRHGFALEKVDVDTDPALAAEHGLHVPVVAVNGKVRFRGVVNPVLLRRLLETTD